MKVEGKSRTLFWVHVNAAHRGTQVFHTQTILQNENLKHNTAMRVFIVFGLNNDPFVAGASGKTFAIQIFEQRNRILT